MIKKNNLSTLQLLSKTQMYLNQNKNESLTLISNNLKRIIFQLDSKVVSSGELPCHGGIATLGNDAI